MKWIGFIKGPQTALFLFVICYLCFHIVSLFFLPLSRSDFLSQIMQGYFSLSSSRLCIFIFLHMIRLLVSLDSSPPSPPYLLFFVSSSTHIQLSLLFSMFLGVCSNITSWLVLWSLLFCHRFLHHDSPWRHNTDCSPTAQHPQVMLWETPVPSWVHAGTRSQAISTQKENRCGVFLQVLWFMPSVKGLLFTTWCT